MLIRVLQRVKRAHSRVPVGGVVLIRVVLELNKSSRKRYIYIFITRRAKPYVIIVVVGCLWSVLIGVLQREKRAHSRAPAGQP